MKLLRDLTCVPSALRGGALAIGNFDGVHRGHAQLIERLVLHAHRIRGSSVVLTFDPHPACILRPDHAPPPLTSTERKAKLLGDLGVDAMLAYPTDEALLELTPTEFFHRIVIESLQARALVEGPNFFFGKNRQGGVQTLAVLCRDHGCVLEVVAPTEDEGTMISSSRIRQLLATGDCDQANTLLTEPYQLQGTVIPGAQRGRQLGFPTANLADVNTLIPAAGVYGGRTWIDGREWPAAINVGTNPTFGEDQTKLEVHVVGFSGQLYGKRLEVDFLTRLRDIQAFVGIDQLKQQLHRDIARAVAACTLAPQQ